MAKKKSTKKSTKKAAPVVAAVVNEQNNKSSALTDDDIMTTEELLGSETPEEKAYRLSQEAVQDYKASHNGEDPGITDEELKAAAESGFTAIFLDENSDKIPEEVKNTIRFAEEYISAEAN